MESTISIGSDHAGVKLKSNIISLLEGKNIKMIDCGTYDENSCDYPDIAKETIDYLSNKKANLSILICGSGVGMSICANRALKVRAALCWKAEIAILARQHNDANVLCLPARFLETEEALNIVEVFLETEFEGGRHQNRINKINPNI